MVESTQQNPNDLLNFAADPAIQEHMEGGETIVFSCIVKKKSPKTGLKQSRNIILTNTRLHSLKGTQVQRYIKIDAIKALTKNIKDKKNV